MQWDEFTVRFRRIYTANERLFLLVFQRRKLQIMGCDYCWKVYWIFEGYNYTLAVFYTGNCGYKTHLPKNLSEKYYRKNKKSQTFTKSDSVIQY